MYLRKSVVEFLNLEKYEKFFFKNIKKFEKNYTLCIYDLVMAAGLAGPE